MSVRTTPGHDAGRRLDATSTIELREDFDDPLPEFAPYSA